MDGSSSAGLRLVLWILPVLVAGVLRVLVRLLVASEVLIHESHSMYQANVLPILLANFCEH
jgi:hypothetical protein